MAGQHDGGPSRGRDRERIELRLIFAAFYAVFLVAEIVARLLPSRWSGGGVFAVGSIFREAKASASRALAFAYMG